jgi:hypothetical protein
MYAGSTVRVVTVRALYRAFQNLMVEGHGELGLLFRMTRHAQLCLGLDQHLRRFYVCRMSGRVPYGLQRRGSPHSRNRPDKLFALASRVVRRVAIVAAHVVTPVLATLEVYVFFSA